MYNGIMLEKAKGLSRSGQRNAIRFLRGVYGEEGDDVFEAFMLRYPKAVVTLETALSLHGIIDEWALPPFCLSFALGYRPVKEGRIRQLWDDDKTRLLGTTRMSPGAATTPKGFSSSFGGGKGKYLGKSMRKPSSPIGGWRTRGNSISPNSGNILPKCPKRGFTRKG